MQKFSAAGQLDWKTVKVITLAMFLVSLSWIVNTYFATRDEFSNFDKIMVFTIFLFTLAIEVFLIFIINTFCKNLYITILIAACFLILNLFCLNLVMNEQFITANLAIKILGILAGIIISFTIFRIANESRTMGLLLVLASAALVAIPIITYLFSAKIELPKSRSNENPSPILRNVAFVDKPNVYFIGFESMAAPAVLAKFLDYHTSPMPTAFENNGFRVFKNIFTEDAPTTRSMNSLLALDLEYRNEGARLRYPFFSGQAPSPLLEMFKSNGYETSTAYPLSFFGKQKGPFVDHYTFNTPFSICTFLTETERLFAFFGVCRLFGTSIWSSKGKIPGGSIEFVLDQIKAASSRKQAPQFMLAHMSPLNHTTKEYTGNPEEREKFRRVYDASGKAAARNLDRIVEQLKKDDPNALLFVFGDHGAYLSRTATVENEKEFYIQDRYGVLGGVYPKESCASSFDKPISEGFTTVPQVARMLIRCLAAGVDPFPESYEHKLHIQKSKFNFEEFRYE